MKLTIACVLLVSCELLNIVFANDVLGCGGFIKSHVQIDFVKVEVILYTKQRSLKDKTNCAPNNGYYFLPLYDKGEYILKINPPPGWSFEPTEVLLNVDGSTDACSKGVDINFVFKGFGITGKVETVTGDGPTDLEVTLTDGKVGRTTRTSVGGSFFFTPVYPGAYNVKIEHPKWKIMKNVVAVTVTEGNTELPPKSLVILGYDVSGSVMSSGEPIGGAQFVLFPQIDADYNKLTVNECDKSVINGFQAKAMVLCHVASNQHGIYTFPSLSSGKYRVVPYYKSRNIHFRPNYIDFTVENDSYKIDTVFQITGITVIGKVLNSNNGKGVAGAIIIVNENFIVTTSEKGFFKLEQLKPGDYGISIEADDLIYDHKVVKVNANTLNLPDFIASGYKVCGVVVSETSQQLVFKNLDTFAVIHAASEPMTGKFCQILKCGKYSLNVWVDQVKQAEGIQFFPTNQIVDVRSSPVYGLTFSQLKATVSGKVKCLRQQDCSSIKIHLVSNTEAETMVSLKNNGAYVFYDIRPGTMEFRISPNNLCWKSTNHQITINSSLATVPDFEQTGYSLTVSSSHATSLYYTANETNGKETHLEVPKGLSNHCLKRYGLFDFMIRGCHLYESDNVVYDMDNAQSNVITLTAMKHLNAIEIEATQPIGDVTVQIKDDADIEIDNKATKVHARGYLLELYLDEDVRTVLIPKSDFLWFVPKEMLITGAADCIVFPTKFIGVKGRVIAGKITPSIRDVTIMVESPGMNTLIKKTDDTGVYRFPPLDNSKEYKVTASRDSYVLTGPDANGNFFAHKLAEILVDITDKSTGEPLQGTLLSLSGGESYRSNLQTNADGKMVFHSLSPGDYFLRPMMKEYSFEPSSQLITIKEGATINMRMMGKRVAFSAYGIVTSLNGEPESSVVVTAIGAGNCSQFTEDTTTEANGYFRIRGLHPYCSYSLKVLGKSNKPMHAVPDSFTLNNVQGDITDIKLVVLHPAGQMDIAAHIYTANPDHYKTLRVKLCKEPPSNTVVGDIKLDTYKLDGVHNPGIIVYFSSVPLDNKGYTVNLDTTMPQGGKYKPVYHNLVANESFQVVYMEFKPHIDYKEQHIKQASVWALLLVFVVTMMFYNIELVVQIVKNYVAKIAMHLPTTHFNKPVAVNDNFYNDDLDKIVQNINATKRKVKPRKA